MKKPVGQRHKAPKNITNLKINAQFEDVLKVAVSKNPKPTQKKSVGRK